MLDVEQVVLRLACHARKTKHSIPANVPQLLVCPPHFQLHLLGYKHQSCTHLRAETMQLFSSWLKSRVHRHHLVERLCWVFPVLLPSADFVAIHLRRFRCHRLLLLSLPCFFQQPFLLFPGCCFSQERRTVP